MSLYADSDDFALGSTYHVLLRATEALEVTVAEMLGVNTSPRDNASALSALSFYKELDLRYRAGRLTLPGTYSILRMVLKDVDRYRTTVANLVGYMSRETALELRKTLISLSSLLEEAVDTFEGPALAKGIRINVEASTEIEIFADADLLQRLLFNLLDNAIKYSYQTTAHTAQRHVDVQCKRHSVAGDVVLSFASYGVGIDPDELQSGRLFSYGVRGRQASDREREGTGIGLAECKRIVDAHGGSIRLASDPRNGAYKTTVTVILPRK